MIGDVHSLLKKQNKTNSLSLHLLLKNIFKHTSDEHLQDEISLKDEMIWMYTAHFSHTVIRQIQRCVKKKLFWQPQLLSLTIKDGSTVL